MNESVNIRKSNSFNYTYKFPINIFTDQKFIKDMDGIEHKKAFSPNPDTNDEEKFDLISMSWGYDERNMMPIDDISVEYTSISYLGMNAENYYAFPTFTADSRKNVYLRVEVRDSAGNTASIITSLCKAVDIVSCDVKNDRWILTLNGPFDADNGLTLVPEFYVVYTDTYGNTTKPQSVFLNGESSITSTVELKKIKYGECTTNVNISSLPNGTYEIYCMPELVAWIFPVYTGVAGKPYTIYKGVTPPAEADPTEADLPTSFSVTVDPIVPNIGKRTVHIVYPDDFTPNPNLTYAVKYFHEANAYSEAFSEFTLDKDFDIPTHYCKWDFVICAYNSKGKSVCTSYTVSSPSLKGTQRKPVHDNIPPTANLNLYSATASGLQFKYVEESAPPFTDDFAGMKYEKSSISSTEGGKKVKKTTNRVRVEYTLAYGEGLEDKIDWTSERIRSATYIDSISSTVHSTTNKIRYLTIPIDSELIGNYLYMRVFDNNNNFLVTRYPLEIRRMAESAYVEKSGSSLEVKCKRLNTDTNFDITMEYWGVKGDDSTKKWNTTSQMGESASKAMTKKTDTFSYSASLTDGEKNTFVRVQPWYKSSDKLLFYSPYYFYPGYYLETGFKCRQKNYIEGNRGLEIFSDKPVLAHTFYSEIDLGESYEKWLFGGIETGIQCEDGSFTYDYDNLDDVPAGNYYTTIIHYADGTVDMTKVKRM